MSEYTEAVDPRLVAEVLQRMGQPVGEQEEFDAAQAEINLLERIERIRSGDDGVYDMANAAMTIAGIEIPATTPQEPPYTVRHIPADADTSKGHLYKGPDGKFYTSERVRNPDYVSPEIRSAALLRAEKALKSKDHVRPAAPIAAPVNGHIETKPTNILEHATRIQHLLTPNYTVTSFALQGDSIVVTLH